MQILAAAEGSHKRLEGDAQETVSLSLGEAEPADGAADSAMQDAGARLSLAAAEVKPVGEIATEVLDLLDESEDEVHEDTSVSAVDVTLLQNALPEPESAVRCQAQASTAAGGGCQEGSLLTPSSAEVHKTGHWGTRADWSSACGQDKPTDVIPLPASGMHEHNLQAGETEQKPSKSGESDIRISVSTQSKQSKSSDIQSAIPTQQEQSKTDSSSIQISICN